MLTRQYLSGTAFVAFTVLLLILNISCSNQPQPMANTPDKGADSSNLTAHPDRRLVIETVLGTIKIQMYEKLAPHHVEQITKLAGMKFYDGTTFHRVIPGFMIQGGDPNSKDDDLSNDGTGGYDVKLKQEFSKVHHGRGACSMARTNDPNSATSQFFICVADAGFLDNQYTLWGQVVEGMDVADKIVALKRNQNDNPGKAATITHVTVEGD